MADIVTDSATGADVKKRRQPYSTGLAIAAIGTGVVAAAVLGIMAANGGIEEAGHTVWGKSLSLGAAGLCVVITVTAAAWDAKRQMDQKEEAIATISAQADELQKNLKVKEDFFTTLVEINFKYIDKYYLQTQVQADNSFYLSRLAAVLSLIIIGAGIVGMFFGLTSPAYVTTAAGVIGELFATVFFYLYNRTILKMGQYHQKLVLTQNISLALKITEQLPPEQKSQAQMTLIKSLTKNINHYLSAVPDMAVPVERSTKRVAARKPTRRTASPAGDGQDT